MSKTSVGAIVVVVGLGAALWLGQRAHDATQAEALATQARTLLQAGLDRAPSLADLRATEARKLAEASLQASPTEHARALHHAARAFELFARGDHAGAASEQRAAAVALPDMPVLAVLESRLLEAMGQPARAREVSARLARGPHADDARVAVLLAEHARSDGHTEAALSRLDAAIARGPAAVLYEQRGLTHELLADTASARADYERAAGLDRNNVTPLLQLGRLLRNVGNTTDALLAFRSALQRDPRSVDARMGLGVCRMEHGDPVGARLDFEEARVLAPEHAQPHVALGDLDLAEGHLESALVHYQRAAQLDKHSAVTWLKLGNALVRSKAADQAVVAFQTAVRLSPDLSAAHNGLGAALLATGDTPAAEDALARAAALDTQDPNPLLNLAMLRKRDGDMHGARAALQEAQLRDPSLELASLMAPARRTASSARHP
jgi:Flp pilus assembly protein TadD